MLNTLKVSLFFIICLFVTKILSANNRVKYNFNPQWKVYIGDSKGAENVNFDDSDWKTVSLPYAWNQEEAFKRDIHNLSTGIAWYRKNFKFPASHKDKKIFLEFEGIRQGGEFYLNDIFIGRHENGVMAFGFDITDFVKSYPAENVIAVRTDNDWNYKKNITMLQGSRNFQT